MITKNMKTEVELEKFPNSRHLLGFRTAFYVICSTYLFPELLPLKFKRKVVFATSLQ